MTIYHERICERHKYWISYIFIMSVFENLCAFELGLLGAVRFSFNSLFRKLPHDCILELTNYKNIYGVKGGTYA